MNSIKINGVTISNTESKQNISVVNGKVIINGKEVSDINKIEDKEINIIIDGEVESVKTDSGNIQCNTANKVESYNGDIIIKGDVNGDVNTYNGNVSATIIKGSVSTVNGNIK